MLENELERKDQKLTQFSLDIHYTWCSFGEGPHNPLNHTTVFLETFPQVTVVKNLMRELRSISNTQDQDLGMNRRTNGRLALWCPD